MIKIDELILDSDNGNAISIEDIVLEYPDTGQADNQQDTIVPDSTENIDIQENTTVEDPLETSFEVPVIIERSEKILRTVNANLDDSASDPFDSSTDDIFSDIVEVPVTRYQRKSIIISSIATT